MYPFISCHIRLFGFPIHSCTRCRCCNRCWLDVKRFRFVHWDGLVIIIFHWRDGPRSIFSTWRNIPDWSIRWRCGRRSQIASYIRLPLQVRMSQSSFSIPALICLDRLSPPAWAHTDGSPLPSNCLLYRGWGTIYRKKRIAAFRQLAFFVVKLQHSPLFLRIGNSDSIDFPYFWLSGPSNKNHGLHRQALHLDMDMDSTSNLM